MIERPNAQLLHFLVLCSVITGSPSESIDHHCFAKLRFTRMLIYRSALATEAIYHHIIKAVLAFAQYGAAGHGFGNEFIGVHMVGVESII